MAGAAAKASLPHREEDETGGSTKDCSGKTVFLLFSSHMLHSLYYGITVIFLHSTCNIIYLKYFSKHEIFVPCVSKDYVLLLKIKVVIFC